MTPEQLAILKTTMLADVNLATFVSTVQPQAIADYYNTASGLIAWQTGVPIKNIMDAIDWPKFTPTDVAAENSIGIQRLLIIQAKQMNLQNMTIGRETLDCSKAGIRAGLRDAVIALPAGAGGANVSAGGTNGTAVLTACTRSINRVEDVFTSGSATTGNVTAKLLTYEGTVDAQIISMAMGW